jgi:hypothetical protein
LISDPSLPSSVTSEANPSSSPAAPHVQVSRVQIWLRRLAMLIFVFVCAGTGVLLVILPWTPNWSENHLLFGYPALRDLIENGFVRGLCSGLGVLDIWIGFTEASHYRE